MEYLRVSVFYEVIPEGHVRLPQRAFRHNSSCFPRGRVRKREQGRGERSIPKSQPRREPSRRLFRGRSHTRATRRATGRCLFSAPSASARVRVYRTHLQRSVWSFSGPLALSQKQSARIGSVIFCPRSNNKGRGRRDARTGPED
jgi:hypothetical protein